MLNTILLILGVLLLSYPLILLFIKKDETVKHNIALDVISGLWIKKHKKEDAMVNLEEISALWRKDKNTDPEKKEQEKQKLYQHKELQEFKNRFLDNSSFNSGIPKKVIEQIMALLDTEGDIPSVVNTKEEPEGKLDKNSYDILSQTSLITHSIHVAEELLLLLDSAAMQPKAIITALGHDLGKLPSYRKKLYALGDHPLISAAILDKIEGFNELFYKTDIIKAIKAHHPPFKAIGLLAEKLKEADQTARSKELANADNNNNNNNLPETPKIETGSPPGSAETPETGSQHKTEKQKNQHHEIFNTAKEDKSAIKVHEMELRWFDPDLFLSELKPHINKLNGARWSAFSMKDGIVYAQVNLVWKIAKKMGRKDQNKMVIIADSDTDIRRDMLYTIVQRLKDEKDAIAEGLIQDNFFGGPFIVKMKDGKELSAFYTPFKAEAFTKTVSELEDLKVGKIRDILQVLPDTRTKEEKN